MSVLRTEYKDRESWLAARTIGASDVGTILGINPRKSAYTLATEMIGEIPRETENIAMRRGKQMEPLIAELLAEETGLEVRDEGLYVIYRNSERPHLGATPDRLIDDNPAELKDGLLFTAKHWKDGEAPLSYKVQLQIQMYCMDQDEGWLCGLLADKPEVRHYLKSDKWRERFLPKIDAFWENVEKKKLPPLDTSQSTFKTFDILHPNDSGATLQMDDEQVASYHVWKQAKALLSNFTEEEKNAKLELKRIIGEHTFAEAESILLSLKTQTRPGKLSVDLEHEETLRKAGIPFKVTEPSTFRVLREHKAK